MLKRFSSLILALVIGSSVLASTVRPSNAHVCNMASVEMMPGMLMPTASLSHEMMPGMQMMPGMHMDHSMGAMPGMEMMPGTEAMPGMEMMPGTEAMPGMEMMPGMHMDHDMEAMPDAEPMPCCRKHLTQPAVSEPGSGEQCCVNIPREPGSSETTFNLRPPSFSIAVIHPAIVQSPMILPKPYDCSFSPPVFLPNLQSSYVRNLSILI